MKKIFYAMAIASLTMVSIARAQVSIGVSIGSPAPLYASPAPMWVPTGAPVNPYYYFPDINCYYDMGIGQYIYFENNAWMYSRVIPRRFAGYDFRGARMVPMSRTAFAYRGIPSYRRGRQGMPNDNFAYRGGQGGQYRGGGNHFGYGRENGHWNNGGNRGGNYGGGRGNGKDRGRFDR